MDDVEAADRGLLSFPPPEMADGEAETIASTHFGLDARATLLSSERDRNFRLIDAAGQSWVLKVTNAGEAPETTVFQTRALLRIAQLDAGLPVPGIRLSRAGQPVEWLTLANGTHCAVRLFSFLEGQARYASVQSAAQRGAVAAALGRLDRALAQVEAPRVEFKPLIWDIAHATQLWPLVHAVEDKARRALCDKYLTRFERHVVPLLPHLRRQVIHNDFNAHNILVDPNDPRHVAGILDFGDMVMAPLVNEVAVAASYELSTPDAPLSRIAEFVSAYHAVLPLERQELDVVHDLIATRMVATISITEWRAKRYPANRHYILRNHASACIGLATIDEVSRDVAAADLRRACGAEALA